MRSKVLIKVSVLAIALFSIFAIGESAFAATATPVPGAPGYSEHIIEGPGNSSTARNCGESCNSIINSRGTGWTKIKTPASGSITYPSVDYGSIKIPSQTIKTGQAAPGSDYYVYGVYAQRDGTIKINGVPVQVKAGDFITAIPVAGIQKADGSFMKEFAAAYYAKQVYGMQYRKDGLGLPESQVLAIYQQMLGSGKLLIDLLMNPLFNGFGGLDGLLTNLPPDEDLCALGLCEPDEPPAYIPPLPSCHVGSHAGWVEGHVAVANLTTAENVTFDEKGNTVWARPGDSIRFSVDYCWGVGAVGGSVGNSRSPWAIFPGGNARTFGTPVTEVWFALSAVKNEKYLFGENEQVISGGANGLKRNLQDPHQETIGATGVGFTDNDVEKTGDYAFVVLSPSSKGADKAKYACNIFDFPPGWVDYGYHIPGVSGYSCPAIANNGGVESDVGDGEGQISQTIQYNKATAWQMWRHNETGDCLGCTQDPEGEEPYVASKTKPGSIPGYNTLEENNSNVRSEPYEDYKSALGAGVNEWGLIVKHAGDTANHPRDCDTPQCGCKGWHRPDICSYACNCKTDADGKESCETCYYECMVDCTNTGGDGCECKGTSGPNYVTPVYDYSTGMRDEGIEGQTAQVNVPYNYYTAATSEIVEKERIYLGETVSSNFSVSILPRSNDMVHEGEQYATLSSGSIQAVEFIVSVNHDFTDDDVSGIDMGGTDDDPCTYYSGKFGDDMGECITIWDKGPMQNAQGLYNGYTEFDAEHRVVPDDDDDLVGAKYCVAVGISHSDSHQQPDGGQVSGASSESGSGWRVSGASCRTIAKKPNFQVWNGHFYTNGAIVTSQTEKHVDAHLGDSKDPTGLFGSWDEYYVIANDEVIGFSSAAGLGYWGKNKNTSLGLQGGRSPGTSFCKLSKMTIANTKCQGTSDNTYMDKVIGYANVGKSMDGILERIYSRYTNPSSSNEVKILQNGAVYVNINEDYKTSNIHNISGANSSLLTNTTFTDSYIRQTKSDVDDKSQQTTSNYASNTLVIYVNGKLTIDTNICTGSGSCSVNNDGNSLTLQGRNSDYYSSIYSIPQILIIAKKGIEITQDVNQIDAWVISQTGKVNTCVEFHRGTSGSDVCNNPLIINGPVIATGLSLNRTAGANPGSGTKDTDNVLYKNLANDGSITPGEIFNLRPDTLYWAYGQSQRFSQANVTYTRELAPRY